MTKRDVATPVVFGAFLMMATTGLLMFFKLHVHLHEEIHEWAGWVMVSAALFHIFVNSHGFVKHLRLIAAVAVVVAGVVGAAFVLGAEKEGPSPSALAVAAITKAPLQQVAPLFGKTPAEAVAAVKAAGVDVDEAGSLDAAAAGDRERLGKALRALSAPR